MTRNDEKVFMLRKSVKFFENPKFACKIFWGVKRMVFLVENNLGSGNIIFSGVFVLQNRRIFTRSLVRTLRSTFRCVEGNTFFHTIALVPFLAWTLIDSNLTVGWITNAPSLCQCPEEKRRFVEVVFMVSRVTEDFRPSSHHSLHLSRSSHSENSEEIRHVQMKIPHSGTVTLRANFWEVS